MKNQAIKPAQPCQVTTIALMRAPGGPVGKRCPGLWHFFRNLDRLRLSAFRHRSRRDGHADRERVIIVVVRVVIVHEPASCAAGCRPCCTGLSGCLPDARAGDRRRVGRVHLRRSQTRVCSVRSSLSSGRAGVRGSRNGGRFPGLTQDCCKRRCSVAESAIVNGRHYRAAMLNPASTQALSDICYTLTAIYYH
jgi:hypothetical protein